MTLTSMIWSLKNGDLNAVKEFFTTENVNVEIDGRRPIHVAADFGQNEIIEYLLSRGADINALDSHGMTAILNAIYEGHTKTVKLLLSKGAKIDKLSPDGRSYVDCAEKSDIQELLKASVC